MVSKLLLWGQIEATQGMIVSVGGAITLVFRDYEMSLASY